MKKNKNNHCTPNSSQQVSPLNQPEIVQTHTPQILCSVTKSPISSFSRSLDHTVEQEPRDHCTTQTWSHTVNYQPQSRQMDIFLPPLSLLSVTYLMRFILQLSLRGHLNIASSSSHSLLLHPLLRPLILLPLLSYKSVRAPII